MSTTDYTVSADDLDDERLVLLITGRGLDACVEMTPEQMRRLTADLMRTVDLHDAITQRRHVPDF